MPKFELFKYWICGICRNSVFWVLAMFLVVGCSHINDGKIRGNKSIKVAIDRVEAIIDDDPELADSLMNLIDGQSIKSKQLRARYALFYTAAEYKNYQPIISDSLIMTAVRFYLIDNNTDYRFLSYYYLGCVYQELGLFSEAGAALANAEQISDLIDNDLLKGLLFSRLGEIFTATCDYKRAKDYFIKSEECFERSGREKHRLYAKLALGNATRYLMKFDSADSILRIVEKESLAIGDSTLHHRCLLDRLSCLVYMHKLDSASYLVNRNSYFLDEADSSFIYLKTIALYYLELKDNIKAESLLERASRFARSEDDSIYLYFLHYKFARNQSHVEKALEYYSDYSSLQSSNLRVILGQPVLAAQNKQYKIMAENEQLKYNHARLTLILCVIIFLLILVIVLVTYHYKKKHMKEQLYESLSVVEELSSKIEDLRSQVRVQFHERHDLSNRLYSMYFDSESQDKITKQQLNVTINSLIKDYTAPDSIRKLDKLLNESYDGIMERLADPEIGLTNKELELFRYSIAGLSSKSVSVIIKESPQNIYQIKSRLLKKVRRNSEELWSRLNVIW